MVQAATETRLRQFVADASHELRTPVSAIAGFADLWREGALPESQLSDVMRRIGQETVRMRLTEEQVRAFREPAKGISDEVLVVLVAGVVAHDPPAQELHRRAELERVRAERDTHQTSP